MRLRSDLRTALWLSVFVPAIIAACSSATNEGTSSGSGSSSSSSGTGAAGGGTSSSGAGGAGGTLFTGAGGNSGPYGDFPTDPVIEPSAPPTSGTLFGAPDSGDPTGGPCLVEPESGALYPHNWLRPRFRFIPGPGQNLFEIRVHADNEFNDLVVYTADTTWTMPKVIWDNLTNHIIDQPITITVRGAIFDGMNLTGNPMGSPASTITIAPADAAGSIVYWTTSNGSSLKGFYVGDETVGQTLIPDQVVMPTVGGAKVTCIGCHTSTPDGKFVGFTAQGPWGNAIASIEKNTEGAAPPFLGPGALATLDQFGEVGISTFSKAHWKQGDRIMIAPFDQYANAKLMWVDLEAQASGEGTSYGFLARNGDPRGVGAPTWSHDGNTVVYVSTDAEFTGRLDNGFADLYAVPYANKAGGDVTPIPGASDPNSEEYYPAFSPDDQWLVFNRIPSNTNMYDQPQAEVFVIPAAGGAPTRLAANDPPACTGKKSPGITNSWPKWAPEATTVGDRTFYWLIFSSRRSDTSIPQLYVTGVVVKAGEVQTFSSIYLWNQPAAESNHTPAWDVFKIPPPPPPN